MSLVLLTPEALLYSRSAPRLDLLREAGFEVRYPKNPQLARGVFDPEPPSSDNSLFSLPNVVLTPHRAGTDRLSMQDMVIESARNIIELAQGCWPDEAVVNRELRASWQWSPA